MVSEPVTPNARDVCAERTALSRTAHIPATDCLPSYRVQDQQVQEQLHPCGCHPAELCSTSYHCAAHLLPHHHRPFFRRNPQPPASSAPPKFQSSLTGGLQRDVTFVSPAASFHPPKALNMRSQHTEGSPPIVATTLPRKTELTNRLRDRWRDR
ncbi:unnamed protein product [Pleuronectes platessa]|uniref:Uncharacterized protein n=1 Tax=Pleuronectes platessa TaxID=8262 RepID=A0A9N7YCU4_PLEPL|nr:unnamed protein product [Pleuronectes platessa]